ncbi:MAG: hypothetical protein U0836_24940 [Pirellulales bacterium]
MFDPLNALGSAEQRPNLPPETPMAKQQNTVAKKLRENQKRQKALDKRAKRKAKGTSATSGAEQPDPTEGYRVI